MHSQEFDGIFCFNSHKMSQNVAFCNYFHEVDSNFDMSTAITDAKLYILFFAKSLRETFVAV